MCVCVFSPWWFPAGGEDKCVVRQQSCSGCEVHTGGTCLWASEDAGQDRDAAEAADLLLHFGKRPAHEQRDKTHTHWTLTTQTQDGFRIYWFDWREKVTSRCTTFTQTLSEQQNEV